MRVFMDRCWCASTNCKNACKRQLPPDLLKRAQELDSLLEFAYFCDENSELINYDQEK